MSFTLQERHNICKGLPIDTTVTFVDKVDAALKLWASRLINGETTKEQLPTYATFVPTNSQIKEWCYRILDSTAMTSRMMASVISDPAIETDVINSSDSTIENSVWWKIASYAAKIN